MAVATRIAEYIQRTSLPRATSVVEPKIDKPCTLNVHIAQSFTIGNASEPSVICIFSIIPCSYILSTTMKVDRDFIIIICKMFCIYKIKYYIKDSIIRVLEYIYFKIYLYYGISFNCHLLLPDLASQIKYKNCKNTKITATYDAIFSPQK